jgi:hypothetical protein
VKLSEENVNWALQKLSRFSDWPGYPRTNEGLEAYARAFLKIVRGKPLGEIYCDLGLDPSGLKDAQRTDAEWLLDAVYENLEEFPKPIVLRRFYERRLPPCEEIEKLPEE